MNFQKNRSCSSSRDQKNKEKNQMKRRFIPALLIATALTTAAFGTETAPSFGIVNFGSCASDSKLGKQEQASFESLKKQMASLLEDTEKQLNELAAKFNDPEYLDGLSPEAEEELKNKFRTLNEELSRYQNQYYQVMNQANMRIMQTLATSINAASEKVAKDKKLSMVVNKDACFYFTPALDVTNFVVAEMDKNFAQESKKQAVAPVISETEAAEQNAEVKK
jgi:outer membrane protein